jgi:hypothetical protein
MLKSAVLYGDEVRVCGPGFHYLEDLKRVREITNEFGKIERFSWKADVFVPMFGNRDELGVAELIHAREQYSELRKMRSPSTKLDKERLQIEKRLESAWSRYVTKIKEAIIRTGYENLEKLLNLERVDIAPSGLLDGSDASTGYQEIFETYFNELVRSVTDVETLPLLDDLAGGTISEMIEVGKLTPNPSAIHRSSHAGLFANLFNRLPEFDKASVDELLDIRRELERPLTNFRAKLSKLSADFDSASWDEDFAYDAQRAVTEHIEPEIQEIEDAIRSNTYLGKLNTRITDKVTQEWAAVLGLAVMSNSATLMVAGAAVSAGKNLIQAKQDLEASKEDVEGKSMYFYYGVGERLSR